MDQAVDAHAAALAGPDRWLLSRFICPASRLAELEESLSRLPTLEGWEISVILDPAGDGAWPGPLGKGLQIAAGFSGRVPTPIRLLETPVPVDVAAGSDFVQAVQALVETVASSGLPGSTPVRTFLEIATANDAEMMAIAAIARAFEGQRRSANGSPPLSIGAKIRCAAALCRGDPFARAGGSVHHACHTSHLPFKGRPVSITRSVTPTRPPPPSARILNVGRRAVLAHAHDLDANTLAS